MSDKVYLLTEELGDDDGFSVLGVFTSIDAAMSALPGEAWESWTDERQGTKYVRVDVEVGHPLPPGHTSIVSRDGIMRVAPYDLDVLDQQPFVSQRRAGR